MPIKSIKLIRTCDMCPEQYEVFIENINFYSTQIGYLRLRHGKFTAHAHNVYGKIVYQAEPKGDGIFDDDEREFYLKEACDVLLKEACIYIAESDTIEYSIFTFKQTFSTRNQQCKIQVITPIK